MKRFYGMNILHDISSYNPNNTCVDSQDRIKSKSPAYQNMEVLKNSSFQSRLDPALSAPPLSSSSKASPNSNPIRKVSHLISPKKTRKPKLYQKSEPVTDNPHSGCKKGGGLLYDERSDVDDISSTDICHIKARYNQFSSLCRESENKLLISSVRKDVVEVVKEEEKGVECSMCGDVGIAELLFFCSKCCLRPQHIYCGRYYPNVREEALICNWCLHDQDSSTSTIADPSVEEHHNHTPAPDGYTDHEASVEIVGLHGKAFDYLLLAAAQSSLPQLISEASDESKKICRTASMINTTGCKIMICSRRRTDWDSDKKAKEQGFTESNRSVANQARIISNDRERSMKRLVKNLNIEIQSAVNINMEQRNCDHNDALYGGENTPERQRCRRAVNTDVPKSRKRGLQMSPARPNNRRYKLLADVVC